MSIKLTEAAEQQITRLLQAGGSGRVKLAYDSEGCGCSVSGVPTLWLVDAPGAYDVEVPSSPLPLLIEQKHLVFFDEAMTIDYKSAGHCYVLKSSGQIYNAQMQLVDKRGTGVQSL